ncbi:MAG: DUF4147 domain-containing protein [Synergistaceae bacterium]|jgi:hydroxypyruvate reductase|nr:DUF4147 domain-containing protein [Synergistaceae bacterium]
MSVAKLRETVTGVIRGAIDAVLPESAVRDALASFFHTPHTLAPDRTVLVAVGKAAWRMASAAHEALGVDRGCVITKDGHSMGPIGGLEILEAAHPVPEERNVAATKRALSMVEGLSAEDSVLFLVSGGGSALFELPAPGVSLADVADATSRLLASGAGIVEINTLRKHLSSVKGGRFALACAPASVRAVVLSDVLGDRLDSIASGPACPDSTTRADAIAIAKKYKLPENIALALTETPKELHNVETRITGSVSVLCEAARRLLQREGFDVTLLTTTLDCEASAAGSFFAAIAREAVIKRKPAAPTAFIAGGETVVRLKGLKKGAKGGRCQEMALAAALGISGLPDVVFAAAGSDGTDGPTDAAGGVVDGGTANRIMAPTAMLEDNDSYHALESSGDLLITGPTGTNVNDIAILAVA